MHMLPQSVALRRFACLKLEARPGLLWVAPLPLQAASAGRGDAEMQGPSKTVDAGLVPWRRVIAVAAGLKIADVDGCVRRRLIPSALR
jgi:hypothetical protein